MCTSDRSIALSPVRCKVATTYSTADVADSTYNCLFQQQVDCRCVLKRKSAPPRKRKTHNLRDFSNKKVYNQTLLLRRSRRKCSNLEMAPKTNIRPKKSNSPNWKGNENKRKCKVCLCVYRMKIICSRHVYTYIRLIRDALQRKTERKRKKKKGKIENIWIPPWWPARYRTHARKTRNGVTFFCLLFRRIRLFQVYDYRFYITPSSNGRGRAGHIPFWPEFAVRLNNIHHMSVG